MRGYLFDDELILYRNVELLLDPFLSERSVADQNTAEGVRRALRSRMVACDGNATKRTGSKDLAWWS